MITLVFFLEEISAKVLLEGLLPRVVAKGQVNWRLIPFEGKQDLERQLVRKMRSWRTPNTRFIVLRDQDAGNCEKVKKGLVALCREANQPQALVRVACREIESWYLGDLAAVEVALKVEGLVGKQNKSRFRNPDSLPNPSIELEKLTAGKYQKVSGSRAIGPYLHLDESNLSHSFHSFLAGIRQLLRR